LPSDAPDGLCPSCGFRAALQTDPQTAAPFDPSALFDPPAPPAALSSPRPPFGHPLPSEGRGQGKGWTTRVRSFGDYELLEEIARGGMGVVYRARQISLNRTVAVKMILAGRFASAADVHRFRDEAAAAANLQHPNIVGIHEVGEHEGQHYFSMDYVEGQNLAELVGRTPLAPRRAAKYLQTIAEAMHYAHRHGILHRDLKPSNVLIDTSGQPRITDFGLAKRLVEQPLTRPSGPLSPSEGERDGMRGPAAASHDLTLTGQVLGSPNFMPPEQAGGKRGQVGPHSDIYSLGAILFYLLSARPPFVAEELTATLQQVVNDEPPSPRLLNPGVPRDLETICLKCLEKEPRRRYGTAQELADELGRFLRNEPILARPIGQAARLQRWCRRKPALASAILLALVLILVLGIGSPIAAFRINRARLQAQQKAKEATDSLWDSYLAQARAGRWSGRAGRRFDSLEALRKAAEIRPSLELRNEAIACMALVDLRVARELLDLRDRRTQAAFDAEYQRYARPDANGTISLRRIADGAELMLLTGCEPPTYSLLFSPDGKYLAVTFGKEARLKVWDLARNEVIATPADLKELKNLAFSPDSSTVAVTTKDGAVITYSLIYRKKLTPLAPPVVAWAIRFHPTVARLAIANEWGLKVEVRDLETGRVIQSITPSNVVYNLAWHPDGSLLAGACADTRVYIWDSSTGEQRAVLTGHSGEVVAVAFTHAGDLLASSSWDGTVRLWDALAARPLISIPSPGGFSHFTADDRWLACLVDGPSLALMELATAHECRLLHWSSERSKGPRNCDFSPDGNLLATGHGDGVRLWDLHTAKEIAWLPEGTNWSVIFAPSGKSLITSGDSGLKQWPIEYHHEGQKTTLRLGPARRFDLPNGSGLAALSGDGSTLAFFHSNQAHVLDAETWRGKAQLSEGPNPWSLAISPDGRWVLTGIWGIRGDLVWDIQTAKVVQELPNDQRGHGAFNPDNRLLVTSGGSQCSFWEVGSWKCLHSFERVGAGDLPGPLAITRDSRLVAVAYSRRAVRLLDSTTWQNLATLEPPDSAELFDLRFSSDGTLLAAVSTYAIHLWDLRAIRQQLAAMNLDRDLPPLPPPATNQFQGPITVIVVGSTNQPSGRNERAHMR